LIPKIRFRTVPELRHQHQEWQLCHELDEFRKALNPAMSELFLSSVFTCVWVLEVLAEV
jgi:hypothetical protein